ncbi:MAG: gluconate 2-dehydrogenase subunit 3 family protein [Actinobacteria bacterium]|nr:gluconate 2-dehydrogenase subunit 3 family protein [Actinomycetota bacterium]
MTRPVAPRGVGFDGESGAPGPGGAVSPQRKPGYCNRFPGFDVLDEAAHWDDATAAVVLGRLRSPEPPRFFNAVEEAAADALFDVLLDQNPGNDHRIPVTSMVDSRLAEQRTDGWHYGDMPADGDAFKRSLALLDADAVDEFGTAFAGCDVESQRAQLDAICRRGSAPWHEFVAARIWSLWMRYACTAFYSHPHIWNDIGFPGPAYPRGYAALGLGKRESFEVPDARPALDPVTAEEPAGRTGATT